jgi:large repetitive protein
MFSSRCIYIIAFLSLTACGGSDSSTAKSETLNPVFTQPTESPPTVDLSGQTGTTLSTAKQVNGVQSVNNATVNDSFSNALGGLRHINASSNVQGNLTLGVTASDTDVMQKVSLYLPNVDRTFVLCSSNCTASFQSTITGFNPQNANEVAGPLRIELVVEDSLGNSAIVDALTVNWQPIQISAVNASRENGVVSVSWSGNSALQRYNVYAATTQGVTPSNTSALENGVQRLAIQGTSVTFEDAEPSKDYHVLVTGIDLGGESGQSAPFIIPKVNGIANQPPVANNETYQINEDESLTVNVLENDFDPEGQQILIDSVLLQPLNGSLSIDIDGNLTYQPNANFNGADSASYQVSDIEGATAQATVFFNILPINDNPVAVNDFYQVDVNGAITAATTNLLSNDSDIDGDELRVSIVPLSGPSKGTVVINADGSFSYQATGDLLANDEFVYQVEDGFGGTASATVSILTSGDILPPIASNDDYQVNEGTTLVIDNVNLGILANDLDPQNLPFELMTSLLVQPQHGQLNLSLDGTFTYIPNSKFVGVDQFQYQIENSANLQAQAFVTITVNSQADIPIALDDNYQVLEDTNLIVDAASGLLLNDESLNDSTLRVNTTPINSPQKGTLTLAEDGSFSYLPDENFNGVDSFTYQVIDDSELTDTANVNIVILPSNDAPIALDDSYSLVENSTLSVSISANHLLSNDSDIDGDTLTVNTTPVTNVSNGSLTLNSNGSFSYTPSLDFNGVDSFSYQISDGNGETATATVSLTITVPLNELPVAVADSFTLNEDVSLNGTSVLANDSDADGDSLTVNTAPIANVSNGSLTLNSNGTFTYTPAINFNGTDSFTYEVSDGNGGTAQATVSLTINAVNDLPVAVADSFTLNEDISFNGTGLLTNDSDVDGDALTVNTTPFSDVSNGSLTLKSDGTFTYLPDANFNGADSFTYQINDGNGGTAQASVDLTIQPVNDAPIVSDQSFDVDEDKTEGDVIGTVAASDIEGDTLTFSLTAGDTGLFNINASTGALSAKGATPFDYETNTQHSVTVTIADDGTPTPESSNITVTVNVLDVLEGNTITEAPGFGRAALGSLELTGIKTQAQFTDSVSDGSTVYFIGSIDNVDKDIYMVAYDTDGTLDASFGTNGIKTFDFGANEYAKAIVEISNDYFITFERTEASFTEICFIKVDYNGDIDVAFGNNGLRCTTENKVLTINDAVYNTVDIFAVGKVQGSDDDLLIIRIDENGDFQDITVGGVLYTPHLILDVSGASRDDEAIAVYNPHNLEVMIAGNVLTANGDSDIFAWMINPDVGDGAYTNFNGGNPQTYDVSGLGKDDKVGAIGGENTGSGGHTAHIVGSTVLGNDEQDAFIIELNSTSSNPVLSFGTNGIAIYDVDGDGGAGTGSSEFTGYAFDTTGLYLTGNLVNGSNYQPFATRVSTTGNLDTSYDGDGYQVVDYAGNSAYALSMSLDDDQTVWLPGFVESGTDKNMIISSINVNGLLNTTNDFVSGKNTLTHSSTPSDDIMAEVIQIQDVAQQGKFLVASTAIDGSNKSIILTRYTSAGLLDTSFDSDGHKQLQIGSTTTSAEVKGLFELSGGNYIVYGNVTESTVDNGFVARIDQNGVLDATFATNGIYTTAGLGANSIHFNQVKADNADNLVAVGNYDNGSKSAFVLRLTSTGSLDTSFNIGLLPGAPGYIIGANTDDYFTVLIDPTNDIFAGGNRNTGSQDMLMVKYSMLGGTVAAFANAGELIVDISGGDDNVEFIGFDSSNNIYMVGNDIGSPNYIGVVKTSSTTGVLDSSFSSDGKVSLSMATLADSGMSNAAIDSNDNIIVVGYGDAILGQNKHMIARVTASGNLDTSFDANGYARVTTCSNNAKLMSVIVLDNSTFIVAGQCDVGGAENNNIDVSKYILN